MNKSKFDTVLQREDGSVFIIQPKLEIHFLNQESFSWSFVVYYASREGDDFVDVSEEYLQGIDEVTIHEILQAKRKMWLMIKPEL